MSYTLETERLTLRLFSSGDAKRVQQLAGEEKLASTTLSLPHPYEHGVAESWIARVSQAALNGDIFAFALISKVDNELIGCVSLRVAKSINQAELAYWVGLPYWGSGFATEASEAVIKFGFEQLRLDSIYAAALVRNPASYRVMEKIGMQQAVKEPSHLLKSGILEPLVHYQIDRKL